MSLTKPYKIIYRELLSPSKDSCFEDILYAAEQSLKIMRELYLQKMVMYEHLLPILPMQHKKVS